VIDVDGCPSREINNNGAHDFQSNSVRSALFFRRPVFSPPFDLFSRRHSPGTADPWPSLHTSRRNHLKLKKNRFSLLRFLSHSLSLFLYPAYTRGKFFSGFGELYNRTGFHRGVLFFVHVITRDGRIFITSVSSFSARLVMDCTVSLPRPCACVRAPVYFLWVFSSILLCTYLLRSTDENLFFHVRRVGIIRTYIYTYTHCRSGVTCFSIRVTR